MGEPSDNISYISAAQRLIELAKAGDTEGVEKIIDELTHIRESALFKELGALTRELHESLKTFKIDTRMSELTEVEIPDARDRLNHVITMTEDAANRTLNAIEESMPAIDSVTAGAQQLKEAWGRFRARQMSAEEFRGLCKQMDAFLSLVEVKGSQIQTNLTDALMAQGFQDLTGQIIRKVIALVQEVEESLVQMIRISGQRISTDEKAKSADKDTEILKGQGPHIPGKQDEEFVHGQDDVDELLSSLGF